MNEYRPLTSEEYNTLMPLITRLGVLASNDIKRLVDSYLSKEYDVYLFHRQHEKFILKKIKPVSHDKTIYDQYFDGLDFSVPRILDSIIMDEESYIVMEFADGHDARNCTLEDARNIGIALARIQSHYLTNGGHTTPADTYFTRYTDKFCPKLKAYFEDFASFFRFVQKRFFEAPHSLIHDDLLPINVMLGNENEWIIDWETAGILPYFLDLARFAFVWNEKSGFYISYEAGMTFLDSYYDEMRKNPYFNIDKKQFYQDVAISEFFQYAIFLYFEKDTKNLQSTAYFRFFKKILGQLKLDK